VTLEIIDESSVFSVEIFPSPLPEFLISSNIYEESFGVYQKMIE
jgi:hypothetical protein